jgi:gamma-glutamyltranspeptidase/glutathione hydrolase
MRSALINPDSRQAFVEPDDPRPFDMSGVKDKVKPKLIEQPDEEGRNTTHFTIVDRDGNIVTWTSTIESGWGTGLMVPGFGFMLNNELTDFNSVPAFNPDPNNFNPGANDVAPGKRPRSSMASLNLIDHKLVVQEAIDAPRLAQTSANGSTSRELGFSDAAIQGLINLGHTLRAPGDIGSVQAIVIDQRGHIQFGAADKRRIGGVVSVRGD